MDNLTKLAILTDTIINGNKIKGDEYYENILKSLTKNDINFVAQMDYGSKKLYGTKLEMVHQVANLMQAR